MIEEKPVLIVDDEEDIRTALSQALKPLDLRTDTAENGKEALSKIEQEEFGLVLLNLGMPGMDGMEVLRRLREIRPDIRVIVLTAHGTIDSAVEAMKLGAIDFIQKPIAPKEIRKLVSRLMDREKLDAQEVSEYASYIELAKRCVADKHFDAAIDHVRTAISLDPSRAEAVNFYGALLEIEGSLTEAQKQYRAALALDPTYEAAQKNLSRLSSQEKKGGISFGKVSKRGREES